MSETLSGSVRGVFNQGCQLGVTLSELSRDHLLLAEKETEENAKTMMRAAVFVGAGILFSVLGLAALTALLAVALYTADILALEQAFLLVTVIWFVIGGGCIYYAMGKLKDLSLIPTEALDSLKETCQWIVKR